MDGVDHSRAGRQSVRRVFALYAAVSLVPVVLLGVVLTVLLRAQGDAQGLSAARARANLVAATSVAPLLGHRLVGSNLPAESRTDIQRTIARVVRDGAVLRLRLRDLTGRVVFSSDDSTSNPADDEALDAAHGENVAHVTRLDADVDGDGIAEQAGPRVVEVYEQLTDAQGHALGVLELYLPYAPIAATVNTRQHQMLWTLVAGLALLWVFLSGVSFSMTRRLRGQARSNAWLATHDVLTGLPNRQLFLQRIEHAVDHASPSEVVAVAVMDLARFRRVNDTLGHRHGDALLALVGERLAQRLRTSDTVARLGADEFGLVLRRRDADADVLVELTELRAAVAEPAQLGGIPVATEASIGFTVADVGTDAADDVVEADALLAQADMALNAAKTGDRPVLRYVREHDQHDSSALELLGELGEAIATGQLVLHFQPKGDLLTGTVTAVEALVRWQHPTRGLIGPDAFVPAAEQTELIEGLTRWVLSTALGTLPRLAPRGGLGVAVNVSARSLIRADFADEVLDIVRSHGADATDLVLEITETALVVDPARAAQTLQRLHEAGVRISVDDFGAGQTSLSYLAMLPIAELKIDKAFVLGMLDDRRKAAIVRSVIELGHGLDLTVTAEGVETVDMLCKLIEHGCDTVQGYLLSRPVPEPEVARRMAVAGDTLHGVARSMLAS